MDLHVDCSCGRRVRVSPAQRGGTVKCPCGAAVDVPRMSKLRREAGFSPIPLTTAEQI